MQENPNVKSIDEIMEAPVSNLEEVKPEQPETVSPGDAVTPPATRMICMPFQLPDIPGLDHVTVGRYITMITSAIDVSITDYGFKLIIPNDWAVSDEEREGVADVHKLWFETPEMFGSMILALIVDTEDGAARITGDRARLYNAVEPDSADFILARKTNGFVVRFKAEVVEGNDEIDRLSEMLYAQYQTGQVELTPMDNNFSATKKVMLFSGFVDIDYTKLDVPGILKDRAKIIDANIGFLENRVINLMDDTFNNRPIPDLIYEELNATINDFTNKLGIELNYDKEDADTAVNRIGKHNQMLLKCFDAIVLFNEIATGVDFMSSLMNMNNMMSMGIDPGYEGGDSGYVEEGIEMPSDLLDVEFEPEVIDEETMTEEEHLAFEQTFVTGAEEDAEAFDEALESEREDG
jgi:hypothetical protein